MNRTYIGEHEAAMIFKELGESVLGSYASL